MSSKSISIGGVKPPKLLFYPPNSKTIIRVYKPNFFLHPRYSKYGCIEPHYNKLINKCIFFPLSSLSLFSLLLFFFSHSYLRLFSFLLLSLSNSSLFFVLSLSFSLDLVVFFLLVVGRVGLWWRRGLWAIGQMGLWWRCGLWVFGGCG